MSEPWTLGPWDISGLERDFSIWGVANGMEVGSREAICFDVQRIEDARLISLAPEMAELLARIAEQMGHTPQADSDLEWLSEGQAHAIKKAATEVLARARGEA